ncbi:DUF2085 domain-containing protein, partial [bacterium]|nr:DUF2085 domain-containing protein [bacterium]
MIPLQQAESISQQRMWARRANRWAYWLASHWIAGFTIVFGLFVGLPFLAPVFMSVGLEFPARIIYGIYSFLCHQLPQRSYFLFGRQFSYSLAEISAFWPNITDFQVLRHFIGTADLGWKVAWSDRMVSMYTSILIFGWLWYGLRKWIRPLPWQGLLLLMIPMGLDGLTHMASDLADFGTGFRDTNIWLQLLTKSSFPAGFYVGDAWG